VANGKAGGAFAKVDGHTRNRAAAFDTATGALASNWKSSVSYQVKALAISGSTVYLGGSFGPVNNIARPRAAAGQYRHAVLLGTAGGERHLRVADDRSRVYVGGRRNSGQPKSWLNLRLISADSLLSSTEKATARRC
jgi:hypothetical protein